jgi:hypothetical protein
MLFTKSLEKRRNGIGGLAIEEAGKAVVERERCSGSGSGSGYMAELYSEKRV